MNGLRLLFAGVLLPVLTACTVAAGESRAPTACEATFSAARCTNMADYAATQLNITRDDIASISVLPPPTPEIVDGVPVIQMGGRVVETLVTLRDGSVHEVSMGCGGIGALHCRDNPQLEARSAITGGYHDVPCQGDDAEICATPVPPPDPDALAAAEELRVPRLDIPIDHVGHFEVPAGEATLPNGILSDATFDIAAPEWPTDFGIADGVVHLEVRSLDNPDRLFWNIYDHGWVEDTERVDAILVFDVLHHEPGAVLSIRNLVVR